MSESKPKPAWIPDPSTVANANLTAVMAELGFSEYSSFHRWSASDREAFWRDAIDRLGIPIHGPIGPVVDDSRGVEDVRWLPEARLNIAESCFAGDGSATAIIAGRNGVIETVSRSELKGMTMAVANGLRRRGLGPGSRIAIAMPMGVEAVAAYLGIIWAGGVVVSIADSFAAEEIATRLRITGAETVITQDVITRSGKVLPMYDKVVDAGASAAIVVDTGAGMRLRDADAWWSDLVSDETSIDPVVAGSNAETNILFSSGTTGDPKAIAWSHVTPLKSVVDGFYHHDIHATDVVAWPTNLGWMMGPWLIYASLVNGAAMALYDDIPTDGGFGRFVRDAGVTVLGVVPSLVSAWRASGCMEGLDWSKVRLFSSTGEASNPSDMAYLMQLAGGRPVIEYCGGTEIGGGYIAGTVLQPAYPSQFTTAAVGLDFVVLDDEGEKARSGELFVVPPSIGLSTTLLNRDHHEVYFEGAPTLEGVKLRRHGDSMERLDNGNYRALGRMDDTMNLGGIKVSSAEIERVIGTVEGIAEAVAVAVAPEGGGPSRLHVYCVAESEAKLDVEGVRTAMQSEVRAHLNPLFKIEQVAFVDELPRTASNKVMRRKLRALAQESAK